MGISQKIYDTDLEDFVFYVMDTVSDNPATADTTPTSPSRNYDSSRHFIIYDDGGAISKDGPVVLGGALSLSGNRITGLHDPEHETDAATRKWVEEFFALGMSRSDDVIADDVQDPVTLDSADIVPEVRFIVPAAGGLGAWSGASPGDVEEWDGSAWIASAPSASETRFVNSRHALMTWVVGVAPAVSRWVVVHKGSSNPQVSLLGVGATNTSNGTDVRFKVRKATASGKYLEAIVGPDAVYIKGSVPLQATAGGGYAPRALSADVVPAATNKFLRMQIATGEDENGEKAQGITIPTFDSIAHIDVGTATSWRPVVFIRHGHSHGTSNAYELAVWETDTSQWKIKDTGQVMITHNESSWGAMDGHGAVGMLSTDDTNHRDTAALMARTDVDGWGFWKPWNIPHGIVANSKNDTVHALDSVRAVVSTSFTAVSGRSYVVHAGTEHRIHSRSLANTVTMTIGVGSDRREFNANYSGSGIPNDTWVAATDATFLYRASSGGSVTAELRLTNAISIDGAIGHSYIYVLDVGPNV